MKITASKEQKSVSALGYVPMDEIHEEFETLVARASQCANTDLLSQLGLLKAHLHSHFSTENHWMLETDFPASECHINEHAAVLQSAEQVYALVSDGDFSIGRSFIAELQAWFPPHADYLDSALAHWMCKRRLGGKPIVLHPRMSGTV